MDHTASELLVPRRWETQFVLRPIAGHYVDYTLLINNIRPCDSTKSISDVILSVCVVATCIAQRDATRPASHALPENVGEHHDALRTKSCLKTIDLLAVIGRFRKSGITNKLHLAYQRPPFSTIYGIANRVGIWGLTTAVER